MAASESPRLRRKVDKHDEDIRAQGDTLDEIRHVVKGHTESLARIDATVAAIDSRVDHMDGSLTTLRLNVGLLSSSVKTLDGRMVRLERQVSTLDERLSGVDERLSGVDERHGELLEEILRRLKPLSGESGLGRS